MKYKILSGNALKIIAAISMLFDHIGLLFFPNIPIFRIMGRVAFPIFAFMIAEGAKYTKNRLKHFLTIFSVALICQLVYFFFDGGSLYMCILVTFSISTLLIYALQEFKKALFSESSLLKRILFGGLFFGGVILTFFVSEVWNIKIGENVFAIDYGFIGCITPVLASLFDFKDIKAPEFLKNIDKDEARVLSILPAIIALIIRNKIAVQPFSVLAIPLLLMYSSKRGSPKLKYFFYIFYPLHLAVLYGIAVLVYTIL